jgi:hypothetical protein
LKANLVGQTGKNWSTRIGKPESLTTTIKMKTVSLSIISGTMEVAGMITHATPKKGIFAKRKPKSR